MVADARQIDRRGLKAVTGVRCMIVHQKLQPVHGVSQSVENLDDMAAGPSAGRAHVAAVRRSRDKEVTHGDQEEGHEEGQEVDP